MLKQTGDLCGHEPPTDCAISREIYLGDMPAQHLEENSRGSVEDIVEASGKDFATKFRASPRSTGDVCPATFPACRASVPKPPSHLCGHVPLANRASCCQNHLDDTQAPDSGGHAQGPVVEDLARVFAEDFGAKFQATSLPRRNGRPPGLLVILMTTVALLLDGSVRAGASFSATDTNRRSSHRVSRSLFS